MYQPYRKTLTGELRRLEKKERKQPDAFIEREDDLYDEYEREQLTCEVDHLGIWDSEEDVA